MRRIDYPPDVLRRIAAEAESDPEREVCGFVVRRADGTLEVAPVRNALGDGAAGLPLPRSARNGYLADPAEHLRLERRLREEGGAVVAAYHSHVDGPATFSRTDEELALVDGSPVLPGTDYVVVGLSSGTVREVRVFTWNGRRFEGWEAPVPGRLDAARHAR